VHILNTELSKAELGTKVVRKKRLEEAEHGPWVVTKSVLSIETVLSYYFDIVNAWYRDVPCFGSGCQVEVFVDTEDVYGALI
jgi:hypothetical protein